MTGLAVSHDTLLRIIYRTNVKPRAISSVIGIDEFAWRKGHTYGTIICDFITSRTVAILQDRQPETVTAWLKQHPHIQIVSRDGLLVFKEAIHAVNPTIEQISDRWHFIKNCKKRLDDLLLSTIPSSVEKKQAPTETSILPLAKYEERALERKESKRQLIARVQIAYKAGHSMQQLAKQFQLNPRTIKKYITAGDSWLETPRAKKRHPFHKRILYLEEERMTVKDQCITLEMVTTTYIGAITMVTLFIYPNSIYLVKSLVKKQVYATKPYVSRAQDYIYLSPPSLHFEYVDTTT